LEAGLLSGDVATLAETDDQTVLAVLQGDRARLESLNAALESITSTAKTPTLDDLLPPTEEHDQ